MRVSRMVLFSVVFFGSCLVLAGCGGGGSSDSSAVLPGAAPTSSPLSITDATAALAAGGTFPGETVTNTIKDYTAANSGKESIHNKSTVSGTAPSPSVRGGALEAAVKAATGDLSYQNPNCLACHSKPSDITEDDYKKINKYYTYDILSQTSKDASVAMAHVVMLPFITGANDTSKFPLKANSSQCRVCHQNVDTSSHESAANLRRNVDVELCVSCHGPSFNRAVFYQK